MLRAWQPEGPISQSQEDTIGLQEISYDLAKHLSLQHEPVGVGIYKDSDPLPAGLAFDDREFESYCQAVVLAGEGETLLLQAANIGCKLGISVLGCEEEMECFLDDGNCRKRSRNGPQAYPGDGQTDCHAQQTAHSHLIVGPKE